jgi:uncharacterized protein (DUF983 family)
MTPSNYTREEEERVLEALRGGVEITCPRCGGKLASQHVPPKPELPYVRDRIWLICDGCHRSVVFDRRRVDELP